MESRVQQRRVKLELTWVTLDNNKKLVDENPPDNIIYQQQWRGGTSDFFMLLSWGNVFWEKWNLIRHFNKRILFSFQDEPRKLQVVINPVEADRVPQTASVDEIKKITGTLSLSSPSAMVNALYTLDLRVWKINL